MFLRVFPLPRLNGAELCPGHVQWSRCTHTPQAKLFSAHSGWSSHSTSPQVYLFSALELQRQSLLPPSCPFAPVGFVPRPTFHRAVHVFGSSKGKTIDSSQAGSARPRDALSLRRFPRKTGGYARQHFIIPSPQGSVWILQLGRWLLITPFRRKDRPTP